MEVGAAALALVALLGAAIGSFINVVAHRLPLGLSVVRPSSRCPACGTPIHALHNIPIFGWLLLRGRCASCKAAISPRYPLVELAMALLTLALFVDLVGGFPSAQRLVDPRFAGDVLVPFVLYLLLLGGLVVITLIDLDWFIIPNEISLPGIPLGVASAAAAGHAIGVSWQDAAMGAALGVGVLLLVALAYGWITGRTGMGGGDWKLLGAIGAYLGWQALPFVLFAGSLQGLAMALVFRRSFAVEELPPDPAESPESGADHGDADGGAGDAGAKDRAFGQLAVPFGPFLALGAIEYLLFREELRELLTRYLSAVGLAP